ncbi:MAG: protein phosphatase 2C domain-containing protein [Treponema sp.]|nr:protein phosphatase 2C domain-containing protein [Treponema sp.]
MNEICVSKVGASHLRDGKPLQDSAKVLLKKGYAVFSVADGHGGERYFRSDVGSHLAVEIAEKQFFVLLRKIAGLRGRQGAINWDATISALEQNIVADWKDAVQKHFAEHPFSDEEKQLCESMKIPPENFDLTRRNEEKSVALAAKERTAENAIERLYGTTLISCLYIPSLPLTKTEKSSLWIAIQIGDGACLAKKAGGEIFCPIEEDKNLGFGMTTSLCSSNAAKDFRHEFGFDKLDFICVCTDGVQDSFTADGLQHFVQDIHDNIKTYGAEREQQELEDFFPRLSEQGSGDDVSFAGIFVKEKK